jgi:hypothetical protein
MVDFQKVFPSLLPELTTQARLNFLPGWQSTLELCFACFGQTQPPLSPVFARPFCDPALPAHDVKGPGESRTVHGEDFAEPTLGDFSGKREGLQDGELGDPQIQWAQRIFV